MQLHFTGIQASLGASSLSAFFLKMQRPKYVFLYTLISLIFRGLSLIRVQNLELANINSVLSFYPISLLGGQCSHTKRKLLDQQFWVAIVFRLEN